MHLKRVLFLLAVLALPLLLTAAKQQDVVGYWKHQLQPGYNHIAFPVLPDNPTVRNVIGDRLGDVEISAYDPLLNRYRTAVYNSADGKWSGDLYLLGRGTAYWIHLLGDSPKELLVTGFPEQYTKFQWSKLGYGWKHFAPTYGKAHKLADVPPDNPRDVLIKWDRATNRFVSQTVVSGKEWQGEPFDKIEPDQAYIIQLNTAPPPRIGPPTELEQAETKLDVRSQERAVSTPVPVPLLISNQSAVPICYHNGQVCTGGFTVQVIKEHLIPGTEADPQFDHKLIDEINVGPAVSPDGKFNIVLTVSEQSGLSAGDRVFLTVVGPGGSKTSSTSFVIPENEFSVPDVTFPQPLSEPGRVALVPTQFKVSSPYPSPFNSSFRVDFSAPVAGMTIVRLYDVNGRTVKSERMALGAGTHRLAVKGGGLANGLYIFELSQGSFKYRAKVTYLK